MADNKKYYYMRLKENFFETDALLLLEAMPDGYLYSNILLKMYLKSLKGDGRLMYNQYIPYDEQMLATITHHQVGTVKEALEKFRMLGLIDILDNGAIYMLDIQEYIGQSSSEADRKRLYDRKIAEEKKKLIGNVGEISEKSTPELEIELKKEIEKDIDIDTDIDTDKDKDINIDKEKNKKTITMVLNSYAPSGSDLRNALNEFKEMRSKMKKPLTVRALEMALKELDKLSGGDETTKIAIVDQTLQHGWQTFYELKVNNNYHSKTNNGNDEVQDIYKKMLEGME